MISNVPDISPGEMPKASDWNNLKQWAQRDIPRRFIEQPGGGGGDEFNLALLLTPLVCGGTANAKPLEEVQTETGDYYFVDEDAAPVEVWDSSLTSGGFGPATIVQWQASGGKNRVLSTPCIIQME